jgi:hypothetical protein
MDKIKKSNEDKIVFENLSKEEKNTILENKKKVKRIKITSIERN